MLRTEPPALISLVPNIARRLFGPWTNVAGDVIDAATFGSRVFTATGRTVERRANPRGRLGSDGH
jgi:hypothetical protein